MILMIIAVILIALFIILSIVRVEHHFKALKIIVMLLIILVIGSSIYSWVQNDDRDLNSPVGVVNSLYAYFGWMGHTGEAVFEVIRSSVNTVGNVIKGNSTSLKDDLDGRR